MTHARVNRTARRASPSPVSAGGMNALAAGLAAGAVSADDDQFQLDNLDIVDAPVCMPVDTDELQLEVVPVGHTLDSVRLGYDDGVEVCPGLVKLDSYPLPSPTARFDHPDTRLNLIQDSPIRSSRASSISRVIWPRSGQAVLVRVSRVGRRHRALSSTGRRLGRWHHRFGRPDRRRGWVGATAALADLFGRPGRRAEGREGRHRTD